ncbi:MAG: DNA-binding YbaB/EbfC family protein [Alphaproteobacteria bacterium]|jgi:DNA-binding YbaB/EbfC family protein
MFKGLGNMADMFKQAQELQKNMTSVQEKLDTIIVTGASGAGLVTVEMTAKGTIKTLKIDPSLAKPEEIEILQDLVASAINDAKQKAEEASASEMEKATGGLSLPEGFTMPF